MIITRTPLRIPLGGGGTDLPPYYSQFGGYLITAAINKYVWIIINRRFQDSILLSYSKTEIVDTVDEIEHPIIRECLRLLDVGPGLEIVSIADVPSNTGLGSSSSFTVGLLHALHTYKRETRSAQQLAEEAFHIEVEVLGEPIGKQDQYAAAVGGIIALHIDRKGVVDVQRIILPDSTIQELENAAHLFYTGIHRRASDILGDQGQSIAENEQATVNSMHEIKRIGAEVERALVSGELSRFGQLLDDHWQTKKRLTNSISSSEIDRWYDLAKAHGASGGKIMGAGGGGFFMLYADPATKNGLRATLEAEGLEEMRYAIDHQGSKIVGDF